MKLNKTLILSMILTAISLPSFARDGAGSSGGGHAVGNELLDFAENNGSTDIHPETLPCYKTYIDPILAKIKTRVPDLVPVIQGGLTKSWLIESKPLKSLNDSDSLVMVDEKIVAIQNDVDVRISKAWFEDPKVNEENRAGLILHELFQNYRLAQGSGITVSDIREMVRVLFANPFPTADELAADLSRSNFGTFYTAKEIQGLRNVYENLDKVFTADLCAAAQANAQGDRTTYEAKMNEADNWMGYVIENANELNQKASLSASLSDLNFYTLDSQMLVKQQLTFNSAMGSTKPDFCN